ncbi:ribosomal protein S18-alanine N-acetyltransferase [Crocosphaera chwakensis]|uniref:Ribosomal-protein-alanine acetyltransferase n=1 Tax=Crocosphaera chwakensis CCY0110 TaxID=391612 RepID=A3IK86_9CHRO|nr:ribosomal protein S18-alanine N-acetyltransferase [Crocosphaera chwakensis]EAZ93075.1 ribosomal-protein-alanine acetyltransferase [Crocosphaera chwakensis CCY0110]
MSFSLIQLRTPQLSDLDELVTLDKDCLGGLWTKDGYQRELKSSNSHFWVLSSHLTQTIIGCGCFWEILEEAHITLLMIAPRYQSQGLGQLLLYGLLRDAVKRKLERATLEVRVSNQPALSLYRKFGFQVAGRRTGYYKKTGEDALVLWLSGLHYPQFQQELSTWEQQIKDRLTRHHWQFSILKQ